MGPFASAEAEVAAYAAQLEGLSQTQAQMAVSMSGLTAAQQEQVLAFYNASNAITELTAKQFAEAAGIDAGAFAKAANCSETDKLTLANLELALSSEALTNEQRESIAAYMQSIVQKNAEAAASRGQTVANLGLLGSIKAIGKAMLSTPMGWISLAMTGLPLLIKLFESLADSATGSVEEIDGKITELRSDFEQISSDVKKYGDTFKSLKSDFDDVVPRFLELAEGVDEYGNNVSLTSSEYEEFIGYQNQIAEMFPELDAGYDSNGNHMLALSGTADTLRQSLEDLLEVQRQEANAKIAEKLPEAIENLSNTSDSLRDKISKIKDDQEEFVEAYNKLQDVVSNGSNQIEWKVGSVELENEYRDFLKQLDRLGVEYSTKLSGQGRQAVHTITINDTSIADDRYDSEIEKYKKQIQSINDEIASNWDTINPLLQAWLETDLDYTGLSDKMQQIVSRMVGNIDFNSLGLTTAEEVENYISNNIIAKVKKLQPESQAALAKLYEIPTDSTNVSDYTKQIEDGIQALSEETGIDYEELMNLTGFRSVIDSVTGKLSDLTDLISDGTDVERDDWVNTLSLDELTKALDYAEKYGITTIEGLKTALDDGLSFSIDLTKVSSGIELVNKALEESASVTGLSAETVRQLTERYQNLKGFDPEDLFERTTTGIKLNTRAVQELEMAYHDMELGINRSITPDALSDAALSELKQLGEGGNVDLTLRPTVDTSKLANAGWDVAAEGAATVFTSTFSNEAGNIAANFTPIIVDPNGNYVGVMTPQNLQEYAEGVINGTKEDILNLQIGAKFEGDDAIDQAEAAAERIHEIHENVLESNGLHRKLELLAEQYDNLTQQINNCADAKERQDLYTKRDQVLAEINSTKDLASQYMALTSAYNQWQQAKSQADNRSDTENVAKGYEDVQKLLQQGWVTDPEVEKYLNMMLSASERTGDNIADFQSLTETIAGTNYNIMDFFTLDDSGSLTRAGIDNFVQAVYQTMGDEFVHLNKDGIPVSFDFSGEKIDEVAARLGMSVEAVQFILKAMQDAGYDVQFDSLFSDIDEIIDQSKDAISALQELKDTGKISGDVDFSLTVSSLEEVESQLDRAKRLLEQFKKEDGSIDFDMDGAKEAAAVLQSLIYMKIEMSAPAVFGIEIDDEMAQTEIGKALTLINNFKEALAYYDYQVQIGADTTEAKANVDAALAEMSKNSTITETLEIDTTNADAAMDSLGSVSKEMLVEAGLDSSEVDNYDPDNLTRTVTFRKRSTLVDAYIKYLNGLNITKMITFSPGKMPHFASGTSGAKKDEDALTGEEGEELMVRDGRYYMLGTNGPEIVHVEKGDVIFDAEKTKGIIQRSRIGSGRISGKAYDKGTVQRSYQKYYSGFSFQYSGGGSGNAASASQVASKVASSVSESLEDQLSQLKEELDDILDQFDFDIFMAEKQKKSSKEIIAIYRKMQEAVNAQANKYRSMGVAENNEYIRELQRQWWEYEEAIREARKNEFDDWINDAQFAIDVMTHDKEGTDKIVESWRDILKSIKNEIAYYTSQGYDITSDEIQDLMQEMWDAEDQIKEILDSVLDDVMESIDRIQDLYKSLREAADEYTESQYISLDTYQKIVEMGVEYMAYLRDENGNLKINRQRIVDVLAAKTQQMAVEAGLNYVRRIGLAIADNERAELERLLYATEETTNATWGLVYANLAFLKLDDRQRAAARKNLDNLRALADNVSANIAKSLESEDGTGTIKSAGDALQDILDLTKDLVQHEKDQMVDALDEQLDKYKEIIDKKKESLALTKSELEYNKEVQERTTEIAKLQARISALELDDSREAAIERAKLLQELNEKQADLEETQRDHAYDLQTDALDKQQEEFEKMINDRKEEIENETSSEQKLYDLAIHKIETEWDTLFDQLISWNYEYGRSLNKDIIESWDAAREAAERYGSFVEALNATGEGSGEDKTASDIVGASQVYEDSERIQQIAEQMQRNSMAWFGASDSERRRLENENAQMSKELSQHTNSGIYKSGGTWYRADGSTLYSLNDQEVDAVLAATMKQNSIAWFMADEAERKRLAAKNEELASYSRSGFTRKNGTWYDANGNVVYTISDNERAEIAKNIVSIMKANSRAWSGADNAERNRLSNENVRLANSVAGLLNATVTRDANGTWYINGRPLYDVYHKGGVVGGGDKTSRERFAVLEKGEMVLADKHFKALDRMIEMSNFVIGKTSDFKSVFNGFDPYVFQKQNGDQLGRALQARNEQSDNRIIHVDASLTVTGVVDDQVLDVISRHPRAVAEEIAKQFI